LYDAVFLATRECSIGGAVNTLGTFQFENIMHGFTYIEIASSDVSRLLVALKQQLPDPHFLQILHRFIW
jgi:hypothetical protein